MKEEVEALLKKLQKLNISAEDKEALKKKLFPENRMTYDEFIEERGDDVGPIDYIAYLDGVEAVCHYCYAKMVSYKHTLTQKLVKTFIKFYQKEKIYNEVYGPNKLNLRYVDLYHTHWNNFYKLQYWGVVEPIPGTKKTGYWRTTPLGLDFLAGNTRIPKHTRTYRNIIIPLLSDDSIEEISIFDIKDLDEHHKDRSYYISEMAKLRAKKKAEEESDHPSE